jgi:hypothetical protein
VCGWRTTRSASSRASPRATPLRPCSTRIDSRRRAVLSIRWAADHLRQAPPRRTHPFPPRRNHLPAPLQPLAIFPRPCNRRALMDPTGARAGKRREAAAGAAGEPVFATPAAEVLQSKGSRGAS